MAKAESRGLPKVDDADRIAWIARCDPGEPLDPVKDRRYYDLNKAEDAADAPPPRGEDDALALLREGILSLPKGSCQLFSGFSGTGKSTELRQLTNQLRDAGYVVLLADASAYHDLGHRFTREDLLVLIAGAFSEEAANSFPDEFGRDSFWARLKEFLTREIQLEEVGLNLGLVDFKATLKNGNEVWQRVSRALANSPKKLQDDTHTFVGELVDKLRQRVRSAPGVVFILDNLERITSSPTKFEEVLESLNQIIVDAPDALRLPRCHTIYTVPPFILLTNPALREKYGGPRTVLPAVRVLERGPDDRPHKPGIRALSKLLGLRLPLDVVFGPDQEPLRTLIIASGGHVRTLISLVRELLIRARLKGFPISLREVQAVLQPLRESLEQVAWRETLPLLAQIAETGTLAGLRREDYPAIAGMLENRLVLCYRNGDGWFEVYPLIRDYLREKREKREKAAEG